jgi:hypothetical protein
MKAFHTSSLSMRKIFTYMMENGYEPRYEDSYILFEIDGDTSVLELENGILSVRTFFTIDEEGYEMFLEASNLTMIKSVMIRPVVLEDMKSIMFSCESFCESMKEFKRNLPKLVEYSRKGLEIHKNEMKNLIQATEMLRAKKPASDDIIETGTARGKILS